MRQREDVDEKLVIGLVKNEWGFSLHYFEVSLSLSLLIHFFFFTFSRLRYNAPNVEDTVSSAVATDQAVGASRRGATD